MCLKSGIIFKTYNLKIGIIGIFNHIFRRRIESAIATISPENVTDEEIQETSEDLGEILGRVLETKIGIRDIIRIFEE